MDRILAPVKNTTETFVEPSERMGHARQQQVVNRCKKQIRNSLAFPTLGRKTEQVRIQRDSPGEPLIERRRVVKLIVRGALEYLRQRLCHKNLSAILRSSSDARWR